MEDVRRPSYYKSYERKPQTVEDEAPNLYSIISLFMGLAAVFFNSRLLGWLSLFTGVASLTWMKLVSVDKFNILVTLGFAFMSMLSSYVKTYFESMKK
ncbi:uncharacterized protein [Blastocystis hominis]|uniref:Uncharacterized protein n=1 Tax=Blastocystis hominis TaxID=12968 RepID=D8MAQ4_BLAHO|nr:uncharacterized protein [Blastocystis hominis]CBK25143.2 unnamed protein product [Blastocystis hominis]|eukprot:XP_012899191.1 uncharacterized protein [Blastocystis hominis]